VLATINSSHPSGSSSYDSIRSLAYKEADVFLLCYRITDPASLYNVKHKWAGEVRRHRPDAPLVLCGCAHDLRTDEDTTALLSKTGRTPVSREQGLAICCEIGAFSYAETSAKADDGAESPLETIELCVLAAIKAGKVKRRPSTGVTSPRRPSWRKATSSTSIASASATAAPNVSFGSRGSSLDKRASKVNLNASFTGSENGRKEEEDVFPAEDRLPPLSPRFGARPRTGFSPPSASTFKTSSRVTSAVFPDEEERRNSCDRRASLRLQRSPLDDNGRKVAAAAASKKPAKAMGFESFKSTGSQGSTGSKASATEEEEGESPELLHHFVSPKTGVFRPAAAAADSGRSGKKQSCSLM